jgi:hypothetical protein
LGAEQQTATAVRDCLRVRVLRAARAAVEIIENLLGGVEAVERDQRLDVDRPHSERQKSNRAETARQLPR